MVPVSDLSLADLFVHIYVWIDDARTDGTLVIPPRPGPTPACSDAELLTIALVRHLLARPSESAFLREVRRDWSSYFPHLPVQSEVNRRLRWLWGAFEQLRQRALEALPADGWQQIDTTALPVKHPSRVRGPDSWIGPDGLVAGFGWDAAHHEWFYGFRLALRTDLGHRVIRSWGIVPAAVDERAVADALVEGSRLDGLLLDRGFCGRTWADRYRQQGIHVLLTPSRAERRSLSVAARRPIAVLRNRIETTNGELTEQLALVRHHAKSFCGLLTRTAACLLAHTVLRLAHIQST
jgi:Transposase DDE domain